MAVKVINPGDAVQVTTLVTVIFGCPGIGKTSLAQTADGALTLDFDKGAHRSFNRKKMLQFETWSDMNDPTVKKMISEAKTIIIDTAGRMLDVMTAHILATDSKAGKKDGSLGIGGWGALKTMFATFIGQLRLSGKDIILICHEKAEKKNEDTIFRFDIQGGSYSEVHKASDIIAYMTVHRDGTRTLSFAPTEESIGKDPAYLGTIVIDKYDQDTNSFHQFDDDKSPRFMANLLADCKKRMSLISEKQAKAAAEDMAKPGAVSPPPPPPVSPPVSPPPPPAQQQSFSAPPANVDPADSLIEKVRAKFERIGSGNAAEYTAAFKEYWPTTKGNSAVDIDIQWVEIQKIAQRKKLVYDTTNKYFTGA
jgi:hypothetical protein